MNEYVKKEKVELALTADVADMSIEDYISLVSKRIKALPSADVKPVVFCKDCKKYKTKFCAIDMWTDQVTIYKATPYDYCSRGERGKDNG